MMMITSSVVAEEAIVTLVGVWCVRRHEDPGLLKAQAQRRHGDAGGTLMKVTS
jgi:hypothetical protein